VQDVLDSLPSDLSVRLSNLEIVIEDEPPPGQRLLDLYQGIPLTRRSGYYGGVLPDKSISAPSSAGWLARISMRRRSRVEAPCPLSS
jgi:hypothetical protein